MKFAEKANKVFEEATELYHVTDDVDAPKPSPCTPGSVEATLFDKNWIDAVQWHLEDIIRDPEIDPVEALALKRRIDRSNQDRTDMVEELDTYFRDLYKDVEVLSGARFNTESPAWAFDRLSILVLKIYHMKAEIVRRDASLEHKAKCNEKLEVLLQQRADLMQAIDELLDDISSGHKYMRVYRQMKMYNDPDTNPILYGGK